MKSKSFMINSSIEFGLRALVLLSQIENQGIDICMYYTISTQCFNSKGSI